MDNLLGLILEDEELQFQLAQCETKTQIKNVFKNYEVDDLDNSIEKIFNYKEQTSLPVITSDCTSISCYCKKEIIRLKSLKKAFRSNLKKDDISLQAGFECMHIESIKSSEHTVYITLVGKLDSPQLGSINYGRILIKSSGMIDSVEDESVDIQIVEPKIVIQYDQIVFYQNQMSIPIIFDGISVKDNITSSDILFENFKVIGIDIINRQRINIHVESKKSKAAFLNEMDHSVLKINKDLLAKEIDNEIVFVLPKVNVNCSQKFLELENFDYNLSYENGYKGVLHIRYFLEANSPFNIELSKYILLKNDFKDASFKVSNIDQNTCEIDMYINIDVDNGDAFWGMILNGNIIFKAGFLSNEILDINNYELDLEVLLHDQHGGAVEDVLAFISNHEKAIGGLSNIVSGVATVISIGETIAELTGLKESIGSNIDFMKSELESIKNTCIQINDRLDAMNKEYYSDKIISKVDKFNVSLRKMNEHIDIFFDYYTYEYNQIGNHEQALAKTWTDVDRYDYFDNFQDIVSLLQGLDSLSTIKPVAAFDNFVNGMYVWDSDAYPERKAYRVYIKETLDKSILMLAAIVKCNSGYKTTYDKYKKSYEEAINYLQKNETVEQKSKIVNGRTAAYNLVTGSYLIIKDSQGKSTSSMNSTINQQQLEEMLYRSKLHDTDRCSLSFIKKLEEVFKIEVPKDALSYLVSSIWSGKKKSITQNIKWHSCKGIMMANRTRNNSGGYCLTNNGTLYWWSKKTGDYMNEKFYFFEKL